MKQRRAIPFVLVAALSMLTACRGDPDHEPIAKPDWPYQVHEGDQYVALGDSYTAAPRTGRKAPGSGKCQNTVTNYPHRIARKTGVELIDASCNGASTPSLRHEQQATRNPPQLDVVDQDTDLITFRLGANDESLYAHIIQCAVLLALSPDDADGDPCTELDADQDEKSVDVLLPKVQDAIHKALEAVKKRAPEARIIVISYPRVAPDHGTCEAFPLPAGDYAYARRIIEGVNEGLKTAAEDVGADYIDMYAASKGHDVCSKQPWVAGYPKPDSGDAAAWHPYPAESEAVAKLVLAELRS